jgi:signal peptidase II
MALGLIVSGAVGNAVDRIRMGEVTDFIHVDLGFWPLNPWPIFNVADSAVCVGAAIVIWRSWRSVPGSVRPAA